MTEEEFNTFLATVKPIPKKNTPAIIVDIDGTVARRTDRGPFDHARVYEDDRIHYAITMAYKWLKDDLHNRRKILFVTGRPLEAREQTILWLEKKSFGIERERYDLYTRGSHNRDIPGPIYKYNTYINCIKDDYEVEFVMENSLQACKMYRALGLNVFHVMSGKYPWSEEK
jgi:hypothetical protein